MILVNPLSQYWYQEKFAKEEGEDAKKEEMKKEDMKKEDMKKDEKPEGSKPSKEEVLALLNKGNSEKKD